MEVVALLGSFTMLFPTVVNPVAVGDDQKTRRIDPTMGSKSCSCRRRRLESISRLSMNFVRKIVAFVVAFCD